MKFFSFSFLFFFLFYSHNAQTISFVQATGSPIANTNNQRGLVSGDINNDGIVDLIVGNAYANNLSVYIGLGNGQFSPSLASPVTVNTGPIYIAIGDFNGDSNPDLATANYFSNDVSILLGNGLGSFTVSSTISTGSFPYCIAVEDFNLDGNKDLITCSAVSGDAHLLIGNGLGSFTIAAGSPFSTGGGPYHVSTGFFNSDAFPDFAVANGFGSFDNVNVFMGNGSGTFTTGLNSPYTVGSQPRTIAVKDLNSDGFSDFVVTNFNSNNIDILLGSASGSFVSAPSSPINVGSGPYQSTIADFDLNGTQDIAISNNGSSNITILSGSGSGTFSNVLGSPISIGWGLQPICSDDFNGDGLADIAAGEWNGSNINVLINISNMSCSLSAAFNYSIGNAGAVNFNSLSSGTMSTATYTWNFGDATNSTGLSVMHTYSANGTYTVTLMANNNATPTCINSATQIITINNVVSCNLVTAFNYTIGSFGQVTFNSASSGTTSSTAYVWTFGDATNSTGLSAMHTYSANGTYSVTLMANNNATPTCINSTTQVITINNVVSCNLVTAFNYTVGSSGQVTFNSASSGTTSSTVYVWNFGDAINSTGLSAMHTYSANGTYTVTLMANNNATPTCINSATQIITINNVVSCNLITAFNYTVGSSGQVTFNSASSGTTSSTTCIWIFGDGTNSIGLSATHTYTANGTYTVTLITNNNTTPTCINSATQIIEVNKIVSCSLITSFNYTTGSSGLVTFSSLSSVTTSGTTYIWIFGDGTNSNGLSTTHTYTANGLYTATLIVNNNQSPECISVSTKTIEIRNAVNVSIKKIEQNFLSLSPNPTSGIFEIKMLSVLNKSELVIYNLLGQEELRTLLLEEDNTINAHSLNNGVHIYHLYQNNTLAKSGRLVLNK
jgi:PKD repeat protein